MLSIRTLFIVLVVSFALFNRQWHTLNTGHESSTRTPNIHFNHDKMTAFNAFHIFFLRHTLLSLNVSKVFSPHSRISVRIACNDILCLLIVIFIASLTFTENFRENKTL